LIEVDVIPFVLHIGGRGGVAELEWGIFCEVEQLKDNLYGLFCCEEQISVSEDVSSCIDELFPVKVFPAFIYGLIIILCSEGLLFDIL
jgi:hypothetical protein